MFFPVTFVANMGPDDKEEDGGMTAAEIPILSSSSVTCLICIRILNRVLVAFAAETSDPFFPSKFLR